MHESVGACVRFEITKYGLSVGCAIGVGTLDLHGEIVVADAAAALAAEVYGERFGIVSDYLEQ